MGKKSFAHTQWRLGNTDASVVPTVEIVPSSLLYGLVDVRKVLQGGYRQKSKENKHRTW